MPGPLTLISAPSQDQPQAGIGYLPPTGGHLQGHLQVNQRGHMMLSGSHRVQSSGEVGDSSEDRETVTEAEAQLKEAQDLVSSLDKLDNSCAASRDKVKATAAKLISQIKDHEKRLLQEIEDHHHTELKKVPVSPNTLRDLTKRFEKLVNDKNTKEMSKQLDSSRKQGSVEDPGTANTTTEDNENSLGLDSVIRLVAVTEQQLSPGELVMSEMKQCPLDMLGWLDGYEMPEIRCVKFVPIRCNTSFGSIEAEGDSSPKSTTNLEHRSRHSISLLSPCASPCDLRSLSPERSHSPNTLISSSTLHRTRSLRMSRSTSPRHYGTYPAEQLGVLETAWEGGSNSCRIRRHHSMKVPKDMNRLSTRAWSPLSTRRSSSANTAHNSPVRQVSPETFSLLWQLTDTDRFNSPTDVVFLPSGDLAVADRDNERVQVISWKKGAILRSIGQGKIRPQRLAVTPDNHLAVTDLKSGCVKIFTLDGRAVSSWGKKRFKSTFHTPCGLAINSRGQYIVSDMAKQTVSVHQPDGKLLHLLGSANGEFHSPAYVTTARGDKVVVADNWNNTVKFFSNAGEFLYQLDEQEAECHLDYPNGVCVDDSGDILVAEWGKHRISRYTGSGRFVRHLLTRDEGIHYPAAIAAHGELLAETEYSDTHSVVRLFQVSKRQNDKLI